MKAIMVMYDTLNRQMLQPYGCDWIPTPNFQRLADHAVTFEKNYVGSMPCMPARRELHTGRLNFEHRGWGPLEPYDDSVPEILSSHGIYTHLTTDHEHYWQDGGATYHSRYSSFSFSRGQEGDHWKCSPELMDAVRENRLLGPVNYYDRANRAFLDCEEKMPQAVTFAEGLDFIDRFHGADSWFLQIETFDPHEPFFTQPAWKAQFPDDYDGPMGDWPPYYMVTEGADAVDHVRRHYAALIAMCDHYLGEVLDRMDRYGLWEDTLLIVNTDHGFLLGEHGWWSKSIMPPYEEISHIPLFLWDPVSRARGERRTQLTQTIDLPATLLDFFGVERPKDMEGRSLLPVIREGASLRDYALFGFHEGHCCVTDGAWVYLRAPVTGVPYYEYTLMPTHMTSRFGTGELQEMSLAEPFSFTKGCKTLKIQRKESPWNNDHANFGTKLFHLTEDPNQEQELENPEMECRLANAMLKCMRADDCPAERYARFGLPAQGDVTVEDILRWRSGEPQRRIPGALADLAWEKGAANMYLTLAGFLPPEAMTGAQALLRALAPERQVGIQTMMTLIERMIPEENRPIIQYFALLASRTF